MAAAVAAVQESQRKSRDSERCDEHELNGGRISVWTGLSMAIETRASSTPRGCEQPLSWGPVPGGIHLLMDPYATRGEFNESVNNGFISCVCVCVCVCVGSADVVVEYLWIHEQANTAGTSGPEHRPSDDADCPIDSHAAPWRVLARPLAMLRDHRVTWPETRRFYEVILGDRFMRTASSAFPSPGVADRLDRWIWTLLIPFCFHSTFDRICIFWMTEACHRRRNLDVPAVVRSSGRGRELFTANGVWEGAWPRQRWAHAASPWPMVFQKGAGPRIRGQNRQVRNIL